MLLYECMYSRGVTNRRPNLASGFQWQGHALSRPQSAAGNTPLFRCQWTKKVSVSDM
eukprot:COSAG01_NODE_2382_length_7770_cov_4.692318_2_plen_57_part_00